MRIRQKRKVEKRRRAELHRVLDLYLDINGMQASKRAKTGDHPTAFLEISGHVGTCRMSIHPTGWKAGEAGIGFESTFAPKEMIAGDLTPGEMIHKVEAYLQEVQNGIKDTVISV